MHQIMIYGETPACLRLRTELRIEKKEAFLCNPDMFRPSDVIGADAVHFPPDHVLAPLARIACETQSVPFHTALFTPDSPPPVVVVPDPPNKRSR